MSPSRKYAKRNKMQLQWTHTKTCLACLPRHLARSVPRTNSGPCLVSTGPRTYRLLPPTLRLGLPSERLCPPALITNAKPRGSTCDLQISFFRSFPFRKILLTVVIRRDRRFKNEENEEPAPRQRKDGFYAARNSCTQAPR